MHGVECGFAKMRMMKNTSVLQEVLVYWYVLLGGTRTVMGGAHMQTFYRMKMCFCHYDLLGGTKMDGCYSFVVNS
jgi:hypothetical protein